MSTDKIFGYTWQEIQDMQQGKYIRPKVANVEKQVREWSESDEKLFRQYGSIEALIVAGYFGLADRAKKLGRE